MNKHKRKPIFIHIDGPDKTGKDSVRVRIVQLSEGSIMTVVRSYISQIAYLIIYDRSEEHVNQFFDMWFQAYLAGEEFVFIDCDYESVKQRFIDHDEQDLAIEDWKSQREVFLQVIERGEKMGIKIKKYDTTIDTVEQSAIKIIKDIT
jgi:hypothetical protein